MPVEQAFPHVVFHIAGVGVHDSVLVTWAIMVMLAVVSAVVSRRLRDRPGALQNAIEVVVETMEHLISEITPFDPDHFLPLVGTLGVFLMVASAASLVPGVSSPSRDLNTAVALAGIVFVSVHVYGIWLVGAKRYLRVYIEPSWLLLPFNIVGEITRTLALALRLFGNALSGELIVAVLAVLASLLVPVTMQLYGLLVGVIQAYVFTLLAMVYIAAGLRQDAAVAPKSEEKT